MFNPDFVLPNQDFHDRIDGCC